MYTTPNIPGVIPTSPRAYARFKGALFISVTNCHTAIIIYVVKLTYFISFPTRAFSKKKSFNETGLE